MEFPATATTPGEISTPTLLHEMYEPWPPVLLGGMAATLVLMLYPPVTVPLAREWQESGRPPDPCHRLIPRWQTAVTGTRAEVVRLKRRAAAAHAKVHGEMPAEVDASRFGARHDATDAGPMAAMYVIITSCMLAAQEFLYRRLADDTERDRYCGLTAETAGFAFGVQDPPTTIAGLRAAYEDILMNHLQGTDLGRRMLRALLATDIDGTPGAELAARTAPLLDPRVTDPLGLAFGGGTTKDTIATSPGSQSRLAGHGQNGSAGSPGALRG